MRGLPADSDGEIFRRPAPELVARIWDEYGQDAACERWYWLGHWNLSKMAVAGRAALRVTAGVPQVRGHRRSTTPEQEAELVALVLRVGSVDRACRESGRCYATVVRVLREAGVRPPKEDRRQVALRAAATKRLRAAA